LPGVLSGLTVLDLSSGISGPMTGMLLGDQGARVLKIEPPGGDPTRSLSGARVWHRGKQSVVLDLTTEPGRDQLLGLVPRADVVIESHPPGMTERMGIDYSAMQGINPRIIYCSITGYGDLAAHAGRPAIDALVAARTGLQWEKRGWPGGSIEHINGVEPFLDEVDLDPSVMEGPPRPGPLFSAIPWPSLSAFYLASMGISAALHARELTGRGQWVQTSLFQGALVNGTFTWQRVEDPDRPGYRMWVTDPRVPHGFFQTSDARWIHNWIPQPSFILGVSSGDELRVDSTTKAVRDDDSRVGTGPEDQIVLLEYLKPMADAVGRFPAAEWERAGIEARVSVQTIRSPEEALQTEAFLEDGCVVEVDDPEVGPIRHVGITYHLHAAPGAITSGAPMPGQDTEEVLAELLGPARTSVGDVEGESGPGVVLPRGPLSGVLVLDLGLVVAGPYGTQMLADLGADVIKVNRVVDNAWTELCMGMSCNRGKRSITINLKSAEGAEVFHQLVRRADVVHTNIHLDAIERLGVDYESLKAINPALIYCHTRGFENGPRILMPGHDQSASAMAGVAWEEGGMYDGGKPIWPNLSLGDTGNGMLSATAVIQALYHRDRTGEGQFVDTSIIYVHLLNASAAWVKADGSGDSSRPHLDALHLGTSALHRLYETEEGWLCMAVSSDQEWHALCRALDRPDLAAARFATAPDRAGHDQALADLLSQVFSLGTAQSWFDRLDAEGVPVEISSDTFALGLFDDPELIAKGLVVSHQHPLVGKLEMFGRLIEFSDTPGVIDRPPLVPGQDTREILHEFGYDAEQCDDLIERGAVSVAS
jgi:crotonobetainyl-CoA:carnitine CoA-transferase CaiB-like acyl-CoA transferase